MGMGEGSGFHYNDQGVPVPGLPWQDGPASVYQVRRITLLCKHYEEGTGHKYPDEVKLRFMGESGMLTRNMAVVAIHKIEVTYNQFSKTKKMADAVAVDYNNWTNATTYIKLHTKAPEFVGNVFSIDPADTDHTVVNPVSKGLLHSISNGTMSYSYQTTGPDWTAPSLVGTKVTVNPNAVSIVWTQEPFPAFEDLTSGIYAIKSGKSGLNINYKVLKHPGGKLTVKKQYAGEKKWYTVWLTYAGLVNTFDSLVTNGGAWHKMSTAEMAAKGKPGGVYAGHCMVCGKGLSDPESVAAGIGPHCQKTYGGV